MIKKKAVFRNMFSNHTITPQRLYNFGHFVLTALTVRNKNGEYTILLSELKEILDLLLKENCKIDTGLTAQVNSTKSVDEKIAEFIEFIKDVEPVIARALGGRKSAGYRAFYPRTVTEYDNTNKSNITLLTGRIYNTAETYKEALGEKLANELQAFKEDYRKARSKQRGQIVSVSINRGKRKSYFVQAQWLLTATVHYVAFVNRKKPGNSESIFRFEMLYPKTKHRIFRIEDKMAAKDIVELINSSLNKRTVITVRNTCVNADLSIWAAKTPGEPRPADALQVKPLRSLKITAAMRANWQGDLLIIQNNSTINEAHYKVEIAGLSKKRMPPKAVEVIIENEENEQPLQMIG